MDADGEGNQEALGDGRHARDELETARERR